MGLTVITRVGFGVMVPVRVGVGGVPVTVGVGVRVAVLVVGAVTVVVAELVLLAGFLSVVAELTVAVLLRLPVVDGFTRVTIVMFQSVLAARLARVQVRVLVERAQVLESGAEEMKVTPAGNISVTVNVVASDGPLLCTEIVYVSTFPAMTGSGLSAFVMLKSAWGLTIV